MKALSIKQPWAWLICRGFKDVENRPWPIGRNSQHGLYSSYHQANFQLILPGRVHVHASSKSDFSWEVDDFMMRHLSEDDYFEYTNWSYQFPYGALIGEVDIIGCVKNSKSPWAVPGQYHFLLTNPLLYNKPIPHRGQLGFFEVKL